jgi:hypothetical protein
LQSLGLLCLRGSDTLRFLQGQLSNDISALGQSSQSSNTRSDPPPWLLRAGLHNPQGRTLALLALVMAGPDCVWATLPRELIGTTRATLQRYVLRSKVTLSDASDSHRIYGLSAPIASGAAEEGLWVRHHEDRCLVIRSAAAPAPQGTALAEDSWHAADIAAGLPQVYAATSGQFVAQMLNLDCIGAISFTKGCYTGQEVIARAHYRGRVKRRMQRFLSREPLRLSPGQAGELRGRGDFRIVDSAQRADGRCEFLAVVAGPQPAEAPAPGPGQAGTGRLIEAECLPLPYAVPQ